MAIFGFWTVFRGLAQASDTIFRKSEKYLQGYLSRVPKKPYIAKFEQTHDAQIWGNYVTKTPILGFWAVFRGLIQASDTIFGKNGKYIPGYSFRVPNQRYNLRDLLDQNHLFPSSNSALFLPISAFLEPQKWPKNTFQAKMTSDT